MNKNHSKKKENQVGLSLKKNEIFINYLINITKVIDFFVIKL